MLSQRSLGPAPILAVLAGLLISKVVLVTVLLWPRYFRPDFTTDFLLGREAHFAGAYRWAFGAHIVAGPATLVLGMILTSATARIRFPAGHRILGRIQVGCVLGLVAPSGLVMARHAAAGPVAEVSLATLAVATAACVVFGTRAAVARRFVAHRRWMWRCHLLLGSAVVLRLMGGLATVAGVAASWFDPVATWLSWLLPLVAFEVVERTRPPKPGQY